VSYLRRAPRGVDGDDIEPDFADPAESLRTAGEPQLGEMSDLPSLANSDGLFRLPARARATTLDFDEGQHFETSHDEVDLATPDALVGGEDAVPPRLKEPGGSPFCIAAERGSIGTVWSLSSRLRRHATTLALAPPAAHGDKGPGRLTLART
jgi:hypothetical protein